jgi:hypothetical protein
MIPANVDTTVAMHHDSAKIRLTLTPRDWATCWLSAVARIAMPVSENLKKTEEDGEQDEHAHEAPQMHRRHRHRPEVDRLRENSTGNGRVSLPQVMLRKPGSRSRHRR